MPRSTSLTLLLPLAPAEGEAAAYQVRLLRPGAEPFEGHLGDLAAALRSGELTPAQVPLLELTGAVLAWLREHPAWQQGRPPAEVLPPLAAVIALKARLLLPAVPPADDGESTEDWTEWDEVAQGVEALAELDRAVQFLSQRRLERSGLIPAPVPKPGLELPRRQRPPRQGQNLRRLLEAARAAVREVDVPLLARERLSLQGALNALLAFGRQLRHFTFGGITARDWGERTTYFAALLEAVKTGELRAEQTEAYGEIQIELASGPTESAPAPVSPPSA
ncbi:segregation/condensation protein A [Deinococcus piscis]|uniref:Segregation/condensation protein A n=1 Tax=Deinococcus piscis TaxID=394230 RepID=A0ABQ3K1E2_9DEIO|nr:ScpA family protein [Deinococcus piscis]GHF99665.1 segregation/condensation protein A [Deinococcus piscis]